MPNRIIKESVCVSEQIDQLTPFEEVFFYRLLVNCDDYGCFDARERVVSSRLFPLRDIKTADITKTLKRLENVGLIRLYSVGGRPYLFVCKWGEHQRLRVSKHKYPTPEDADSCAELPQVAASCGEMRLESESERESEYESEQRKPQKRFTPPTIDEVKEYCDELKYHIDPQYFIDYYETRGWELKPGQKVKDWKACIRTWKKRDSINPAFVVMNAKDVHGYGQRDYSGEQQKALERMMNDTWGDEPEGVKEKA